jgi:superfamily II DNA or RNA helicase
MSAAVAPPALMLRPYQREALDAIHAGERRGVHRQLVALPTGTGKTVVFAHLLRERGGRALVLAHRDELIEQAVEKLHLVAPESRVGVVKAERDEQAVQVVVASVQTLAQPRRLEHLIPDFSTIIIDEAHHAAAPTYRAILEHVGAFAPDHLLTVGFTATPERGDQVGLDGVFEAIVYQRELLDMITAGYLCDLRALQVQLATDWSAVPVRHGDLAEGALGEVLLAASAPEHTLAAYRQHAAGRKTLVFTPTVAVAHAMAATFQDAGHAAEVVDGTTPLEDRRAILRRLRAGTTRVVANCAVLTEGFDEPSVDCIIVARPTTSRSLYVQMVGRGTRLHPNKSDCLILDLVGASSRHALVTASTLFGLPPQALAREGLVAAAQAQAEATRRGQLVATAVDLFGRRPLRWLQVGERFVLTVRDGWLSLEPQGAGWAVRRQTRGGTSRLLARDLPLDYAQGFAEDYARDQGAGALLSVQAGWRREPATKAQRGKLWYLGQRALPPTLTKGEASDLIGLLEARERVS